ncbi:unnamed protein product, partial [Linum tenue]
MLPMMGSFHGPGGRGYWVVLFFFFVLRRWDVRIRSRVKRRMIMRRISGLMVLKGMM